MCPPALEVTCLPPRFTNHQSQPLNYKPPTTDYELRTTNYRLNYRRITCSTPQSLPSTRPSRTGRPSATACPTASTPSRATRSTMPFGRLTLQGVVVEVPDAHVLGA